MNSQVHPPAMAMPGVATGPSPYYTQSSSDHSAGTDALGSSDGIPQNLLDLLELQAKEKEKSKEKEKERDGPKIKAKKGAGERALSPVRRGMFPCLS